MPAAAAAQPAAAKTKTKEERSGIAKKLSEELKAKFGLSAESTAAFGALAQLDDVFRAYAENPDDRAGFTGSVEFPEASARIQYVLPMRASAEPRIQIVPTKPERRQQRPGARKVRRLTKAQQQAAEKA